MNLPRIWTRLPGPADFLDTVLDDLAECNAILVGIPGDVPGDALAVEVADQIKQRGLGQWTAVRSAEARDRAPSDCLARIFGRKGAGGAVVWIDATHADETATAWANHARLFGDLPDMPRLCVAMEESCAEGLEEDKRLRRRLWRSFVTPLDVRALVERFGRRAGQQPAHIALRSALIAELASIDLAFAERLARDPLGRILETRDYPRESIWTAQVSVLLPLVERERRRLLDAHRALWRLPHTRQDGKEIHDVEDLEIGDMAAQARSGGPLEVEWKRLDWLRRVRNALAHNEAVPWATLTSPVAIGIADFRG